MNYHDNAYKLPYWYHTQYNAMLSQLNDIANSCIKAFDIDSAKGTLLEGITFKILASQRI